MPGAASKQPAFAIVGDAGGLDVAAERFSKRVMAWHRVMLAAFLEQPELPAGTLRSKIFHFHPERCRNASEGVGEGGDQGAVAEIPHRLGANAVDDLAQVGGGQHRCFAGFHHMLRAAYRKNASPRLR